MWSLPNALFITYCFCFLNDGNANQDSCPEENNVVLVSDPKNHTIEFALKIYRLLSSPDKSVNVFFSPLTIQLSLGLLMSASEGSTHQEMQEAIISDKDNQSAYSLIKQIASLVDHTNDLFMTNIIFHEEAIKAKALDGAMSGCFKGEVIGQNFEEPDMALHDLNLIIKSRTNSKITDILKQSFINKTTQLILINAVYLQTNSLKNLTDDVTIFQGPFQMENGSSVSRSLMKKTANFGWFSDQNGSHLAIDSGDYVIILSLSALNTDLNQHFELERLLNIKNQTSLAHPVVEVIVPEFTITQLIHMKPVFQIMGIQSLFIETANLSGLFTESTLFNEVYHQSYLEVVAKPIQSETRTNAVPNNYFTVDRPFTLTVWQKDILMLIGIVRDPIQKESQPIKTSTEPFTFYPIMEFTATNETVVVGHVCDSVSARHCVVLVIGWLITAAFFIFFISVCYNHVQTLKKINGCREEKAEWEQKMEEMQDESQKRLLDLFDLSLGKQVPIAGGNVPGTADISDNPSSLSAKLDTTSGLDNSTITPLTKVEKPMYIPPLKITRDTDDDPYYVMY